VRASKKTKNTPQRRLTVAESLAQASGILRLPKAALTWAKGQGCDAFRGARVRLPEFQAWWKENGSRYQDSLELPTKDVLERRLKMAKLNDDQRLREIEDKKWLPARETCDLIRGLGESQRSLFLSMEMELPQKLVGLDVITIQEKLRAYNDRIFAIWAQGTSAVLPAAGEWFWEI